jgi:anthranilate phosphoribosyltransferase
MDMIKKINSGEILAYEEAREFFLCMLTGKLTEAQIASTLISMKYRGETPDELAALVLTLDEHKRTFEHGTENTIDTCGTGGDGKSTVNVSTAVSIILASMGYNVVKHGNVAQSGKVGSADILSGLGFDLNYATVPIDEFYKMHNYIFMLAPHYHPALKEIGKVRREIKVPTLFNYVGPLVNPANPAYQIIGINRIEKLDFLAQAIIKLGKTNITVYSSRDGYDEISSSDITDCLTIREKQVERFSINPADFFKPFPMPVVSDNEEAKKLFLDGIHGVDDRVVNLFSINTALALNTVNGSDMKSGFKEVRDLIKEGTVRNKLESLVAKK